jgi:short-subunit dehydrogenase
VAGRRAVITGASAGIGRAIAHGLASEGVDVALLVEPRGERPARGLSTGLS